MMFFVGVAVGILLMVLRPQLAQGWALLVSKVKK